MRIWSTWNCPNLYSFLVNPEPPKKKCETPSSSSKLCQQHIDSPSFDMINRFRLVWLPSEITLLDAPRGSETVVKQVQQRMKPLLWRTETSNDSWFTHHVKWMWFIQLFRSYSSNSSWWVEFRGGTFARLPPSELHYNLRALSSCIHSSSSDAKATKRYASRRQFSWRHT